MRKNRMPVADLRTARGRRGLSMLHLEAPVETGAVTMARKVVPARVGENLMRRSGLVTFGMRRVSEIDPPYLLAADVLVRSCVHGSTRANDCRHPSSTCERPQARRALAVRELVKDVWSGACPAPKHDWRWVTQSYTQSSEEWDRG